MHLNSALCKVARSISWWNLPKSILYGKWILLWPCFCVCMPLPTPLWVCVHVIISCCKLCWRCIAWMGLDVCRIEDESYLLISMIHKWMGWDRNEFNFFLCMCAEWVFSLSSMWGWGGWWPFRRNGKNGIVLLIIRGSHIRCFPICLNTSIKKNHGQL